MKHLTILLLLLAVLLAGGSSQAANNFRDQKVLLATLTWQEHKTLRRVKVFAGDDPPEPLPGEKVTFTLRAECPLKVIDNSLAGSSPKRVRTLKKGESLRFKPGDYTLKSGTLGAWLPTRLDND